jgi:hypothetical protein
MSEPIASLTLRERFHALNAATSREAAGLAAQGKRATLWGLVAAPFLKFLQTYLWRSAWRKGIVGLIEAMFTAYEVFVCHAKLWELHHVASKFPPPQP